MSSDATYARSVPMSFLIRESQFEVAEKLRQWFHNFVNVPASFPPGPMTRGIASYNPPSNPNNHPWTPENMVFQCGDGRWFRVTFVHHGWDAGESGWVYSKPTVISADEQVLPDHTYLFNNINGSKPLKIKLTESVTYEHRRETTTSRTIHFDFGTKLGAKIGGAEAGGSIEAEVTANLGFSDTDSSVKGESTSQTREQDIETEVPPGEAILATISSPTVVTKRDFDINAVWLASMKIAWWEGYDKWGYVKQLADSQGHTQTGIPIPGSDDRLTEVTFPDMDSFVEAITGVNVYWPSVTTLPAPYLDFGGISDAIDGRKVVANGTETATIQHASDYVFQKVTGSVDKYLDEVREDHYITG